MGLLSNAVANAQAAHEDAKAEIASAMGAEDYAEASDIALDEQPYIVQDEAEETAEQEPAEEAENSSSVDPGQSAEGDASGESASGTTEPTVQEGEQSGSVESGQPGASEGQLAELTGGRFTRVETLWKDRCNLESLVGRQGQELGQLRSELRELKARDAASKAARHYGDLSPEEQADVTREARDRNLTEDEVLHDRYLLARMEAQASERESKQLTEQRVRHRDGVDAWLAQQYDSDNDAKTAIDQASQWFPDTMARMWDESPSEKMVDEIKGIIAVNYHNVKLQAQVKALQKQLDDQKAAEAAKVTVATEAARKTAYDEQANTRKQASRAASEASRGSATATTSMRESRPQDDLGAALERFGTSQGGFLKRAVDRAKAGKK